jgi:hypothetical protein
LLAKIEETGSDAAVAIDETDSRRKHWLLSVWRKEPCLSILRNEYERGGRSIHGAVTDLQIVTVECDAASVRNVNTVSDMPDHGTI